MSYSLDQAVFSRSTTALQGWWLTVFMLVAYVAAGGASLWWCESAPLIADDSPGHDPPWYFIRRDAIRGVCHAVALLSCLLVAFMARTRYPLFANMMAWQSLLFNGGHIWMMAWILLNTSDLMTSGAKSARWPTFESYNDDPAVWIGYAFIFALAFLLAYWGARTQRRSAYLAH